MGQLQVELEPREAGFDAERLTRLDRHFETYVENGRLAGWLLVVTRAGRIVHIARAGARDAERGEPVSADTIWRIYSMTKPVTAVAALMLFEEGAFGLKDEVADYVPAFAEARVFTGGSQLAPATEPLTEPIRIWHLLTHTSGLTYGFHYAHPVDALYRQRGFEWVTPQGQDLAACCETWAELPLLFQPGSEWNYGVSSDVLGRVVEVASGRSLDAFFAERIFEPLGMAETSFWTADEARLAALYSYDRASGARVRQDALGGVALRPPDCLQGGGGLVSTAYDYNRFVQMLAGGGELDGVRLLGNRTVGYMTRNHLPGGADLERFGRPLFAETTFDGVGYGLGVSVVEDAAANRTLCSEGEFGWGGAASTVFWVDPREQVTVSFFTQLMPSSAYPIRPELRQLVYQALVD